MILKSEQHQKILCDNNTRLQPWSEYGSQRIKQYNKYLPLFGSNLRQFTNSFHRQPDIFERYNASNLSAAGAPSHSVILHLRQTRTKRHVRLFNCPFVCLSIVSVRGVHPMGGRSAMLHTNLNGHTNLGSTNKHTKFGQLIIRKIM